MNIGGFMPTTLLDYPGKVAATIFTTSCNMRCPFCHNADLVLDKETKYSESEILSYLSKRRNMLDGVCITGGEPTLCNDLAMFIFQIKELGLSVKLDTNGLNPDVLKMLYEGNLIDMVAMDIKSSKESYAAAAGLPSIDINKICESIHFLITSGIKYEFRTTLVKGLHTTKDMQGICKLIEGASSYYIQSFKDNEKLIYKRDNGTTLYSSFEQDELEEFLDIAKSYISNATLRGV